MPKMIHLLGAGIVLAGLGISALPVTAANNNVAASPATATPKVKEFGGKMPLPVGQRIERQNKPSDKLVVEVTHSVKDGSQFIAYIRIVWGDLDNLIPGTGKQYYSNWEGSLTLKGATGALDGKIQFDDGKTPATQPKETAAAKNPRKTTTPQTTTGPRDGSGRDQVDVAAGPIVKWEAAVVGVLDGLRIKITSPTPEIHATLKAGNFTIPLVITPASEPAKPLPTVKPVPPKPLPSKTQTIQSLKVKPQEPKAQVTPPIKPTPPVKSNTSSISKLVPYRS